MAKATKVRPLSPEAQTVFETLRDEFPNGATLAELKVVLPSANPAHLTALKTREMVDTETVEIETVRTVKSKVNRYFVPQNEVDLDESEADTEAETE